ncbi:MAG: hypothetical protein V1790_13460 [Planctomycetota bacterium]
MLQSLSQCAVAYLLRVTPRSVRNYTDLPRNDNGSYDARAILEWVRSKARPTVDRFGDSDLIAVLAGGGSIVDGLLTE